VTRSAKKTLLEAAFVTRIGEDVLTEMLAHVLVTDEDVTAGVAEAVGLDGEKWRAERVSTQESTPEGRGPHDVAGQCG
jgi:2-hydroxychromene-2-carboxylate isomerase